MDFCVYEQYFEGSHPGNGTPRHATRAALLVSTGDGMVRYEASLSFFPHENAEDFRISYDICAGRVLFKAKGRRSKKREALLLENLKPIIDELAEELGGKVFWAQPLIPARYG